MKQSKNLKKLEQLNASIALTIEFLVKRTQMTKGLLKQKIAAVENIVYRGYDKELFSLCNVRTRKYHETSRLLL